MADVKLGYIGLGNMGAPMATRLTEWPGGVTVYDVRAEAMTPLAEDGRHAWPTASPTSPQADIIQRHRARRRPGARGRRRRVGRPREARAR